MLTLEHLEPRWLPCSAADVLAIIQTVNARGYSPVVDVDQDGRVTPLDALLAINAANRGDQSCGPLPSLQVDLRAFGHDADVPPGLVLRTGTAVVYEIAARNLGPQPLGAVSVSIDRGLPLSNPAGDGDQDWILDPGETWHWIASELVHAGLTQSIATLSAIDPSGRRHSAVDSAFTFGWDVE